MTAGALPPMVAMRVGLDTFGADVDFWHRNNWPDGSGPPAMHPAYRDGVTTMLGITKVAEEAGELVGALTKYVEGSGPDQAILDELGDVIIAAAGALRRANDLLGTEHTLGDVVLARWEVVAARDYRAARP